MKLTAIIALATAAVTANALVVGPHVEQVLEFKDPTTLDLETAFKDFGLLDQYQQLNELPVNTKQLWRDLWENSPKEFDQLFGKALKWARPQKKKNSSHNRVITPKHDWDFTVKDNDNNALRGRKNDPAELGIDTVQSYTGYFDINEGGDHLFYWFFESRNDPKNDPVVMWLNGGPGCSSSTGFLFELGPSNINNATGLDWNPHAWNSNASVIFLDQPVGVGFSYEDEGNSNIPRSTRAAAKHVYSFLKLFFSEFTDFQPLPFHIFTESYGGHYGPAFASEIVKQQQEVPSEPKINLASLGVGNGIFDILHQGPGYYDMACTTKGGVDPVLDEASCKSMENSMERCRSMIQACYDFDSALVCAPASYYCDEKFLSPYMKTGRNPYDIRMMCGDNSLCYNELNNVDEFMNDPKVQKAVGAEVHQFESCDSQTGTNFALTGDGARPFHHDVAFLLDNNVPVLVYAGDKDFICNWLGNQEWVRQLDGYKIDGKDGHEQFANSQVVDWNVDGKAAGTLQNVGHFTFLRVFDAGHMVPHDKPVQALSMLNAWLAGDHAFAST